MSCEETNEKKRELSFKKALIGFTLAIGVLLVIALAGIDILAAMLSAVMVLCGYFILIGYKWQELEKALIDGAGSVLGAVFIMILVGVLVGVWIASGAIPGLLYYGLKFFNPKYLLLISFVICSLTSLATGTNWGTCSSVGVALLGIAVGLGVNPGMAAGAIISGCVLGDKMSPLSDSTNLSAASTKTNIFDNVVSMFYTTVPAFLISAVVFLILGMKIDTTNANVSEVQTMLEGLSSGFHISPIVLLPIVLVIVLSVLRVPAIASFFIDIAVTMPFAMLVQREKFADLCTYAINGFTSKTGVESIDALLSRGGATSFAWTCFIALSAGMLSGLMKETGLIDVLIEKVRLLVHGPRSLGFVTYIILLIMSFAGCGQYIIITLPGVAFSELYKENDINSAVLSRSLQDIGSMFGNIVPWDLACIFISTTLGVSVAQFWPYCILILITPIIGLCNFMFGIGIPRVGEKVSYNPFRRRSYTK